MREEGFCVPMTLDLYQREARKMAVYPGRGTHEGLVYTTLGLAGEAGELANHLKKVLRDDGSKLTPERRKAILGELGDILWYVSQCAREMGFTLDEVGKANLEKLQSRTVRDRIRGSGDHR
jgi:NTP pyrophosphatase (non-canonical NTP hydrolase)